MRGRDTKREKERKKIHKKMRNQLIEMNEIFKYA